jgi:pentatricopeptide repeat protein
VQSNVFHYTTVVSGCARAGKWEAALATFSHMHRARVEPNVHTYTSVIHACTAGKRLDLAMRAYALMESSGVVANVHATTALVAACAKVGEWQRALDVLAEAERAPLHDPNVFTYTSAMDACRRAGQATAAVQVLRRMQERGVRANTVTFNTALNACAATRDWQLALTVLQMMKEAGVRPIPFTKVCVAEAFVGAPDAVRESVNVDELVGHTQPRPGRPAAADMGQIQDPPSPQP